MDTTTYTGLMTLVRNMWNYKFHNSPDNYVEPYPNELKPSEVLKTLNPKFHFVNEREVLDYADKIHLNKTLRGLIPFRVTFLYNNPTPFKTVIYAKNKDAAKHKAITEFSEYLKSKNNYLYRINLINMSIKNNTIQMKIKEI